MSRPHRTSDHPSKAVCNPTVSVITVCRNAKSTIGLTIESVVNQSYPDIDYIVIDGASTDGAMQVIQQSGVGIRAISEPDRGIYHAMNKGIRLATGDLLLFLNAGDTLLCPDTIGSAIDEISRAPRGDVYHGGVQWIEPESGRSTPKPAIKASGLNLYRGSLNHQAMFVHRVLFDRIGMYDEEYRLAGDYEWLLRARRTHRCRFVRLNECVANFLLGGLSTDGKNDELSHAECERARQLHYSSWEAKRYRPWIRLLKVLGI